MSASPQDGPVLVTAEARPHPALRKLARACISLARLQLEAEPQLEASSKTPAEIEEVSK